ncbi:glycosyl transferase [Pelodictyon phaeoclathratiforme BU-1]|jgi:glycosyltransferase involved in cell wall biosynthesis|uniref:Glycosyl transferase n=1 Tax=Pelodictyon phaeoclathratiforme (strain DSM 5477 / BU-1) TaxID=324925 RepID=B4SCD3_PELPB|nr:glycosyl transferase [Pelodictyon phaeoclathratiforme BU-1]
MPVSGYLLFFISQGGSAAGNNPARESGLSLNTRYYLMLFVMALKILCLHVAEDQASYRYRVEQFLPFWEEYGIEMHTVRITGKSYPEKLRLALGSKKYDYVWLQRKLLALFFITLIARRSRLLYDYDDALYARESYIDGLPKKPTKPGSKQSISRLNSLLKRTSMVFAGSDALVNYARQFNPDGTFLVPTAFSKVPELPVRVSCSDDRVTFGWIGNNLNLFFLSLIDDAASSLQARYPAVRFSVMSGKPPEGLKTCWNFVSWSKEAEVEWLESIDIGMMPLVDDEWSRGKCAFKLLQYMAHGKPVIASAVGANRAAVIDGVSGYLASSSAEWLAAFESLVTSPDRRRAMGKESCKHFLQTYERQKVQEQMADLLHRHFNQTQQH